MKPVLKTVGYWAVAGILGIALWQCKSGPNEKEQAIMRQADSLEHLLDDSWKRMMSSDDRRLESMKRITTEITTLEVFDSLENKEVLAKINKLQAMRYDPENMGEEGAIDRYDAETDSVWAEEKRLLNAHPKILQYMLVNQLVPEIETAIDSTVFYRLDYDRHADSLNNFLVRHAVALKAMEPKYAGLKKMPVFRIGG